MELNKRQCPYCHSDEIKNYRTYETLQNGNRIIFKCQNCHKCFSETKQTFLEGIQKPISLISQVLEARTEGMGVNAVCRLFQIAKNTLLSWERRFSALKETFMLYAILQQFISQEIEGDELYTKIHKNLPVEDCEGWTVVLMDRASRFVWNLECGKKDQELFLQAMQIVKELIEKTEDLSLLTDGERRYGNILFDICHEIVRSGNRGRPPKVLPEGVKVRVKNKGKPKVGRPRPKYQAPKNEHPDTVQDLEESEIHANHVEAFNSYLRRRLSAYRRKTNTYAKGKTHLQRTLDMFWLVHNFISRHFSTKQVPAVALGILKRGFSWSEILRVQKFA